MACLSSRRIMTVYMENAELPQKDLREFGSFFRQSDLSLRLGLNPSRATLICVLGTRFGRGNWFRLVLNRHRSGFDF